MIHTFRLSHRMVATQSPSGTHLKVSVFFDRYQGTTLSQDRSKIQNAAFKLMDEIESPSPQNIQEALTTVVEFYLNSKVGI
jgi:hypothetical protein